jgi:hypothetical protein
MQRCARILRTFVASLFALSLLVVTPSPASAPLAGKHAPHNGGSRAANLRPAAPRSKHAEEKELTAHELVDQWSADINAASKRVRIPSDWIRAVLVEESGGRTMMAENAPITSSMGAMGLMQLMPDTWREMQRIYGLGNNPYDPRDNILAGAAELHFLYWEYGYPGLFAAYNDGPGMIEAHRRLQEKLPAETANYMLDIASILQFGSRTAKRLPAIVLTAPPIATEQANPSPPKPSNDEDNDDDYYGEN